MILLKRFLAATIFFTVVHFNSAWAQDQKPMESQGNHPMINAWVVDIPSAARVTKIDGVIVKLNRKEKKYELLAPGREITDEDIIRMMSEAVLVVIYEGGSNETFDYKNYPNDLSGQGKWLIFKVRTMDTSNKTPS